MRNNPLLVWTDWLLPRFGLFDRADQDLHDRAGRSTHLIY